MLNFFTRKEVETTKQKGVKTPTFLSPRNRKAHHSINIALMQRIAKIKTKSTWCREDEMGALDTYPFTLEDGGRLAPTAAELVDRLTIFVALRRFLGMGAADSRSLLCGIYVGMQYFDRRSTYAPLSMFFWGMCGENSGNVFMLLLMVVWVPIFSTSCMREVLRLWHTFMFLGLVGRPQNKKVHLARVGRNGVRAGPT
jgi:hypothetical protein